MSTQRVYLPTPWYIAFSPEHAGFRNGDAALTAVKAWDIFETIDLTPPQPTWESRFTGGSRNVTERIPTGAPPSEVSIEGDAKVGFFWALALGAVATVGTDTAVTGRNITFGNCFAVAEDGAVFTTETTEANNATPDDMTLLPAAPVQDDDAYYIGSDYTFDKITITISTAGAGTWTITWKYWNGSAWTALSGVTDGTTSFTTAGTKDVTFTLPSDWAQTAVNAITKYWVKADLTAYTSITTQPLGQQAWAVGRTIVIDGAALTADAYIGDSVQVTSGDNAGDQYYINANGTTNITVEEPLTIDLDADVCKIITAPYTHTITEADEPGSFAIHAQQPNPLAGQNNIRDYLGCKLTSLAINIAMNTGARHAYGWTMAKPVAGNLITRPTRLNVVPYNWKHISTLSLTYNGAEVFADPPLIELCDNISFTCENVYVQDTPGGDKYAKRPYPSERNYRLQLDIKPTNTTLQSLRELDTDDYATDLAFQLKMNRKGDANDYLQIDIPKLKVVEYPVSLTSVKDNVFKVPVVFELAELGSSSMVVKDDFGPIHYITGS